MFLAGKGVKLIKIIVFKGGDEMESFSKIASRFERNLNMNRSTPVRDGYERSRSERDYSERRRPASPSLNVDQIKDAVHDLNDSQLDAIQDMLYDERVDRETSDKELLRAVDNNSKILNKNFRILTDIKADLDADEGIDFTSLSQENKEEILKAVCSNGELLEQVLEKTDILNTLKEELIDKRGEENDDDVFNRAMAERAFIDLEDHVHKENVKCYRNVQSVVEERGELNYIRIKSSISVLKWISVTSLVFGIANLAFLICWFLRII